MKLTDLGEVKTVASYVNPTPFVLWVSIVLDSKGQFWAVSKHGDAQELDPRTWTFYNES